LEQDLTAGLPDRQGFSCDIRRGFVLQRVPHVTLGGIANNPDIVEGIGPEELKRAIMRHSDIEFLHDQPYVDASRTRVAGPFTVESLSPHRSLAFAESGTGTEKAAEKESSGADFERSVLENLQAAGVQNGRRDERLEFDLVESHAGTHVQAIGTRDEPPDGAPARVGIALGPQYGTVSPRFIKDATLEAKDIGDLDLLCVLGFAFDPMAVGAVGDDLVTADESFEVAGERSLGGLPVLLVRMNTDLLMGEDLKKTGSGNLFTVFGEPDIDFSKADDGEHIVHLRGVDVYDPTTGELRSSGTDQVALWMIDTDYDGESFFVRHCYFTGGNDPYDRLKRTLKAEINAEAWETLYRTESRPFPTPVSGRIAVKVINDYGDEVMKVFDLA
jgi:adenine-specific DNA-methyltransferase